MWTPSFPLVRERMSRLAVRGGWASARFGVSVVDRYLRNLDHRHPLKVFDAVLALVSIASAADNDRAAISAELLGRVTRHARSDEPYAVVHGALAKSARLALEAPDEAEKALVGNTAGPRADDRLDALARVMDSDADAATVDERGYFPAIVAMAKLSRAPATTLFPGLHRPTKRWRPARAVEALSRTLVRPTDVN
jgi:hypothetical protein